MKRTLYNVSAGIYSPIPALQFARNVIITEDGTGSSVGFLVKFRDDNFTQTFSYTSGQEPLTMGDTAATGGGKGAIQGWPVQPTGTINARAADLYCMIAAKSGSTVIRVEEYD